MAAAMPQLLVDVPLSKLHVFARKTVFYMFLPEKQLVPSS